jgi:predicted anti-sigma-YlaC factor YlaD
MSRQTEQSLTCQQVVELVTDYLEGQIAEVERRLMDDHLEGCPGCSEYIRQMRLTVQALSGLTDGEQMFPQTRDALLAAFAERRPHHAPD